MATTAEEQAILALLPTYLSDESRTQLLDDILDKSSTTRVVFDIGRHLGDLEARAAMQPDRDAAAAEVTRLREALDRITRGEWFRIAQPILDCVAELRNGDACHLLPVEPSR